MPQPAAGPQPAPPPAPLFLRRKPIYPPLPANPFYLDDDDDDDDENDEILCPNSSETEDEDDADAARKQRARRERVLGLAERYIRGYDLYIHSASLRGPVVVNPWKKERKPATTGRQSAKMAGTNDAAPAGSTPTSAIAVPGPRGNSSSSASKEMKLKSYFSAKKNVAPNGVAKATAGRGRPSAALDVGARRARSEVPTERGRDGGEADPDTTIESFSISQPVAKHLDEGIDWDMDYGAETEEVESFDDDGTPIGVDIAVRWIRRREHERKVSRLREQNVNSGLAHQRATPRRPSAVLRDDESKSAQVQAKKRKRTPHNEDATSVTADPPADDNISNPDDATPESEPAIDWGKKRPKIDFASVGTPPPVSTIHAPRGDGPRKRQWIEPTSAESKEVQTKGGSKASLVRSASHMAEMEQARVNVVRNFLQEAVTPKNKDQKHTALIEKENAEAFPRSKQEVEPALPMIPDGSFDGAEVNVNASIQVPNTPHPAPPPPPPAPTISGEVVAAETPQQALPPPQSHASAPEQDTPWQGTQINLLAAQNDFFKAMAESPLRFDSPERPAGKIDTAATSAGLSTPGTGIPILPAIAVTPINQNLFSASFLTRSSSPPVLADTQAVDGLWGKVLRTPAPAQTAQPELASPNEPANEDGPPPNPTSKTASKFNSPSHPPQNAVPPHLPPLSFSTTVDLEPHNPHNPCETTFTTEPDAPELTPFRAFRTPSPPPAQIRSHSSVRGAALRFNLSPSPPSSASKAPASTSTKPARKTVGFSSFTLESTLEDTPQSDSSLPSTLSPNKATAGAGMGMQARLSISHDGDADEGSRIGKWGLTENADLGVGLDNTTMSFGATMDEEREEKEDDKNENEEASLVQEVAGFMNANKWDIDEELRKLADANSGNGGELMGSMVQRKGRRGARKGGIKRAAW